MAPRRTIHERFAWDSIAGKSQQDPGLLADL